MKTILIVEDQLDVQNLLQVALQEEDYRLLQAVDAVEGLQMARREKPDLLLLDIMMPGEMDGLGLLRALRDDPQIGSTKVIVISARAQHHDQDAAMAEGAETYITKPFRLSHLKACIEQALGNSSGDVS